MNKDAVAEIVADYLSLFPNEAEGLRPLQERLRRDEQFNHRKSFDGHGTGAAVVLSPDRKKLLMVHHKFLNKWVQPGGHWDPEDPNPWVVAQREAEEETGVEIAQALHVDMDRPHIPLEINTHLIPENAAKKEPAHYHYDFRYAFVAASELVKPQESEVTEVAWIAIDSEDPRLQHVWSYIAKLRQFKLV
ncbi:MAG TPA: NUDIX domain-containing protein [Candidatus Saccharimonadales bacterium]|nr:NUDIX domain-containing protein [Candidatus Saccharimonadales bacterium]